MKNKYTLIELFKTIIALVITKIFFKNARLIRRPFYIRGKSSLVYKEKLTTGYSVRFDLPGGSKKTLLIGKRCFIGDYVHIVAHEKVIIGDDCLMASKIFISDTSHGEYSGENSSIPSSIPNNRPLSTRPVIIGNNVWIGEGVTILPGVTIGDGCIIGSNSVVNKNIPNNTIAVGIPAKVIKKYDDITQTWIRL